MMRGKLWGTVALMGLVVAALPGESAANSGQPWTRFEAELLPIGPEAAAEGDARWEQKIHKGVVQLNRFRAKLKIPVPSAALGISDATAAAAAQFQLTLSHDGTAYAVCTMMLTEVEVEDEGMVAEYKVGVRLVPKKNGPVIKQTHGSCDVDLFMPGVQPGVPQVQVDDVATIALFPANTVVVEGTFVED